MGKAFTQFKLDPTTLDVHRSATRHTSCEVTAFVLNAEKDKLKQIQLANRQKLFACCEKMKIPRIFVGRSELVGADDVRDCGGTGTWPAVWRLSEELDGASYSGDDGAVGFRAGCGNGDQSQTRDGDKFFGSDFINRAWDVESQKEINVEPFKKNWVVTKHEQ